MTDNMKNKLDTDELEMVTGGTGPLGETEPLKATPHNTPAASSGKITL